MSNLNLKYRPKSFSEVIGQNITISILSKQIEKGTFKNAYLFAGPSGCGKTTVARIMASTINNNISDPIELDAASNNGVDNIRELIASAQTSSIDVDYKVYIIDECHMLSNAAWNAALKLIEEPPAHCIFIFCTTNPDKIPETILTRVQRFDFLRISNEDITNRLEFICNEEPELVTKYERCALERIANLSSGFMREAISLFDKCIDYSSEVTLDNVETVLGLTKYDTLINLYNALLNKDSEKANNIISDLKNKNSNLITVIDTLLEFFINIAKYMKFGDIKFTTIPEEYKNKITKSDIIYDIVDEVFKLRRLALEIDNSVLLDMLVLSLCRG